MYVEARCYSVLGVAPHEPLAFLMPLLAYIIMNNINFTLIFLCMYVTCFCSNDLSLPSLIHSFLFIPSLFPTSPSVFMSFIFPVTFQNGFHSISVNDIRAAVKNMGGGRVVYRNMSTLLVFTPLKTMPVHAPINY